MRDIAIATAQSLTYEQVEVWCNSLDASGFDGLKIVVGKNFTRDTVDKIISKKNFIINSYEDENNTSVYVNRFYQYWKILEKYSSSDIRFVLATDITDVLFQSNHREQYGNKILELVPILKDGIICTNDGKPFIIVHQYNRVPDWISIKNKYTGVWNENQT